MFRKVALAAALLSLLVLFAAQAPALAAQESEKPIVVASTTVLGSVIEDLAGDDCTVVVLVPPGMCPGHYDVKPSDVYAVQSAKAVFYHGFEGWMQSLAESAGKTDVLYKVSGPWNTLDGAKSYYTKVAQYLGEALGKDYSAVAEEKMKEIDEVADELLSQAQQLGVSEVSVACMQWQKSFVSWLGFNIAVEYGPPETLSTQDVASITASAKESGVTLVIDNLQSGVDFGAQLAEEVGAVHVVLTNFPDAIPGTSKLVDLFRYNANQLFDGLKAAKTTLSYQQEISSLNQQIVIYQGAVAALAIVCVAEAALYLSLRRRVAKK